MGSHLDNVAAPAVTEGYEDDNNDDDSDVVDSDDEVSYEGEEESDEDEDDEDEDEDDDDDDESQLSDDDSNAFIDPYDEEQLPPYSCRYCGVHDPASVAKCVATNKWFCNAPWRLEALASSQSGCPVASTRASSVSW